jgi:hypothetical protein
LRLAIALIAAWLLLAPSVASAASGPVVALGFEEADGTAALDVSGAGNDGTIRGATRTATGRFGAALSFDGTDDWVTVPDASSLDISRTGFTIAAWVNPQTTSGWRTVALKERGGGLGYALYGTSTSARPSAHAYTSTDQVTRAPGAVPVGQWTHLTATWDLVTLRLYVNGTLVSQRPVAGTLAVADGALRIGGNGVWGEFFRGRIDELRVYNRALSSSDVAAIRDLPVGTEPPGAQDPPPPPPPPLSTDPAVVGRWDAPQSWPLVAVHSQVLPDGRVLVWDGFEYAPGSERIWDPATQTFAAVPNGRNLFCSAHVNLPDGRSLVLGGHVRSYVGLRDTNLFDPATSAWTRGPDMTRARWYPTAVTLADGRVLVVSGDGISLNTPNQPVALINQSYSLPEIYDPAANRWTSLPNAQRVMPLYPQLHVLPDGRVADVGPDLNTRVLDVSAGQWTQVTTSGFDGNSSVQYRPGRILKSGSWADPSFPNREIGARSATIDFTGPQPTWQEQASMHAPRAYHTLTMLPDGTVFAGPGERASDGVSPQFAERSGEIWNPATATWTRMSSAQVPRMYHTTQLLLPDGRVLVSGSGRFGRAPAQTSAEIFSPPYLFKGDRPEIAAAPDVLSGDSGFTVETPDAERIASVALTRASSVTHGVDFDSRFVPLDFVRDGSRLEVGSLPGRGVVPPGLYMLWITDDRGVPSTAAMVRVRPDSDRDTQPPGAPGGLTATGGTGQVQLDWNAASDDVGVVRYHVHRSTDADFVPADGNRVASVTATDWTDAGLTPGTYHYRVTAEDAAGNVGPASAQADATVTAQPSTGPQPELMLGFEETSGDVAQDASGGGHDGTIRGALRTESGRVGRALTFDGVDDWVTVPHSDALTPSTSGIAVSAWVNPDTVSGWRTVALKERTGSLGWALYAPSTSGRPSAHMYTTADQVARSATALPVGQWSHVAMTWDRAVLRLYVNGVRVAERAVTAAPAASSGPLRIGGNSVWGEFFRGRIDELRLYDQSLTAAEIQTLAAAGGA